MLEAIPDAASPRNQALAEPGCDGASALVGGEVIAASNHDWVKLSSGTRRDARAPAMRSEARLHAANHCVRD